jgi:hypothetical protein
MKAAAVIRRGALYLVAFGAGAGAMYWFDPELGPRRQADFVRLLTSFARGIERMARQRLIERLEAACAALASDLPRPPEKQTHATSARTPSDDLHETHSDDSASEADSGVTDVMAGDAPLLVRVRAELDRNILHAGLLTVTIHERRVIVSGPVRSGEAEIVEATLREMLEVAGFQLSLTEYENESDMPGAPGQKIWHEQYSWQL